MNPWQLEDQEDEENLLVSLYALVYMAALNERSAKTIGPTFEWYTYVNDVLAHRERFQRRYRMSLPAFNQLTQLLTPHLHEPHKPLGVKVEVVLHCTLRWLAGGSYDDISAVVHVSVPTFYRYIHMGLSAITECATLQLRFPATNQELRLQCAAFAALSSHGALQGCAGAVDGWLCRIKQPSKADADHITSYFSGHYQAYGLNVQATCDNLCRFTSVSIRFPGGTNDARAHDVSDLPQIVAQFPLGVYLVGDNAYPISERLLTPYCATDGMDISKDNFNYYLSQLRIRIEQSFGLMVTKCEFSKSLWKSSCSMRRCSSKQ